MSQRNEIEDCQEDAEAHIRATIMKEFCEVIQKTGLPPMAVMRLAALSLGSIYREVADAHSGCDPCPCGWRPHEGSDIDLLCTALLTACRRRCNDDLRQMRVAGTA